MGLKAEQKSVKPQCQIVVYTWEHEVPAQSLSYAQLAASKRVDVSAALSNASYSKTISAPAGSFSFSLANTQDWKRVIKPGQWCIIYMSNDGDLKIKNPKKRGDLVSPDSLVGQTSKIRCVGCIDRVAVKYVTTPEGALDVTYEVTGRDFGIVYEETNIWHNMFQFDDAFIKAVSGNFKFAGSNGTFATADELIKTIHDLFFAIKKFPELATRGENDEKYITQVGLQWLLPKELLVDLKATVQLNQTFYGHINGLLDEVKKTKASTPIENPFSQLNGVAWEKLKAWSVQPFHELFPELNDQGQPRLFFRPIPWKLNDSGYRQIADGITSYKDLVTKNSVEIKAMDILDGDVGEDNHSRYNHFMATVNSSLFRAEDNISDFQKQSEGGRKFPYAETKSIARYGFRPMHVEVNSMIQIGQNKDAKSDTPVLLAYNEYLYDLWNNAIYFESGSVEIIGKNQVRVGKGLVFAEDVPYNKNKAFYIEGYTDVFTVEANGVGSWTQTLNLTRGVELAAIDIFRSGVEAIPAKFSRKSQSFEDDGDFTGGKE